jgi:hypothetical protein
VRAEAWLFAGAALYFIATDIVYAWYSHDPAGTAALTVSFLMCALISFFFAMTYRRKGRRPEDRGDADIHERAGALGFFPPYSACPPFTGLGAALLALGVVFGVWLVVIGVGVVGAGVAGMVFQFVRREE